MSDYIRRYKGVPPLSQFAATDGTPIVIDTDTDVAYYVRQNVVAPLEPFPDRVRTAYGGLSISTPRAITIGPGYTRIVNYDASEFISPKHVIEDATLGTLKAEYASAYMLNVFASISFTEENASKHFFLRAVESVSGIQAGNALELFVGRNTAGINPSVTFGFDLAAESDAIAIEIGGGDVLANASLRLMKYSINSIG